jgi:hypothetical protein
MGVRAPEEVPQIYGAAPPGPSAASAIGLGILAFLLLIANGRPIGGGADLGAAFVGKLVCSALSAAAAAVLFQAIGRVHPEGDARTAALLFALGTSVWATSQSLGPQPVGLLAVAVAVLCLLKGGDDPAWAGRAGLPLGLAVAAWPANGALVAILVIAAAIRWPRQILWLAMLAAPPMVLRFFLQPSLPAVFTTGLEGLGTAAGVGHLGLLFSPAKGLLIFTPLVIVAFAGLVRVWRGGEHWLAATLGGAFLAHLALVGSTAGWHGVDGWGATTLTAALPLLCLVLPEGMTTLRAFGTLLAVISVAVQLLGAFANDQRWERLYQHPAKPGHPELWDAVKSPIPFYARRRTIIFALPGLHDGKLTIHEHRLVIGGPSGSRFTFGGDDVRVKGADATADNIELVGGARVDGERLNLAAPGDGLFLRVRPVARLRALELRIAGRGRGAVAVEETSFWTPAPRRKEYPVAGDFHLRHPYHYPDSGGPDLLLTIDRGDVSLTSVALVAPSDPENPLQLP